MAVKVKIEDVLPGMVQSRTRFKLGEIDPPLGKLAHALVQGTRFVARAKHNGCLVPLGTGRRVVA